MKRVKGQALCCETSEACTSTGNGASGIAHGETYARLPLSIAIIFTLRFLSSAHRTWPTL